MCTLRHSRGQTLVLSVSVTSQRNWEHLYLSFVKAQTALMALTASARTTKMWSLRENISLLKKVSHRPGRLKGLWKIRGRWKSTQARDRGNPGVSASLLPHPPLRGVRRRRDRETQGSRDESENEETRNRRASSGTGWFMSFCFWVVPSLGTQLRGANVWSSHALTHTHTEKHAHAVDTRDTCGSATSHSVGKILKVVITAGGSLFMFEVMVMCVRACSRWQMVK